MEEPKEKEEYYGIINGKLQRVNKFWVGAQKMRGSVTVVDPKLFVE